MLVPMERPEAQLGRGSQVTVHLGVHSCQDHTDSLGFTPKTSILEPEALGTAEGRNLEASEVLGGCCCCGHCVVLALATAEQGP